ncbi:MAG: prolipoprotein diacylglyceryl transferase [Bacteroidia bacterium]
MYPNLKYLFKDLFGIDSEFLSYLQSFGFLVAVSFLVANYVMVLEMKRKERDGVLKPVKTRVTPEQVKQERLSDLIGSTVVGFLLGFKLVPLFTEGTGGLTLQDYLFSLEGSGFYGLLLAAISGGFRYYRQSREALPAETEEKLVHPYEIVGSLTVAAAISGLIGAKIFHNLENWEEFLKDPIGNLLAFSGLTFYGGLLFGAITVLYLAGKKKIHWRHMLDIGAPTMMLAYGIGRLGCQISGDGDWGIVNSAPKPGWLNWAPDWLWSYNYPHNVLKEGVPIDGCVGEYCYQLAQGVFPTPLYETITCVLLFFVLWTLRTRIKIPGMLFAIYLIMNGVERFLIEKIRVNNKMDFLGMQLTQAEIISFALVVLGIVGILYFKKTPIKKA